MRLKSKPALGPEQPQMGLFQAPAPEPDTDNPLLDKLNEIAPDDMPQSRLSGRSTANGLEPMLDELHLSGLHQYQNVGWINEAHLPTHQHLTRVNVYVNLPFMKEVIFYRMDSGRCPVAEFLDSLGSRHAQKVIWVLRLVEELDRVPTRFLKKLVNTDDIWEIRVQSAHNIFRLLGFMDHDNLVVLNHTFQKKSQKTLAKEIQIAERRKRDYLARRQS